MSLSDCIRFALSAVILLQVCREAGPWTSAVIVLLAIGNEVNAFLAKRQNERINRVLFLVEIITKPDYCDAGAAP